MQKKIEEYFNSGIITFKTGGTISGGVPVEKSYENMTTEAIDIIDELKIDSSLEFVTTTTHEHLFGFTFHLMLPSLLGSKINERRINYPEDINIPDAVLVTTPSFLEVMRKYNVQPAINPKIIITAGSKLENKTFDYAKSIAQRVIEIYGSTETGIIAYRENPQDMLKPFRGIKILETTDDYTKISTEYSLKSPVIISDRIKLSKGMIEFEGRSGRVLKIQEKRILAQDIENFIKNSGFIEDVFCFEYDGKLAAIGVPNKKGREFLIQNDKLELVKNLKKNLRSSSEIVPQIWKFTDLIPQKTNGKIDKEKIIDLFKLNLSLPLVLSRELSKNSAAFKLCFLNNSNFFKGHFTGYPVLAGVVQLFYVNFFAKSVFGIDCSAGQIRKLKFSNIIRPAQILDLILIKTQKGIEFKYTGDDKTYSSGILPLTNIFED